MKILGFQKGCDFQKIQIIKNAPIFFHLITKYFDKGVDFIGFGKKFVPKNMYIIHTITFWEKLLSHDVTKIAPFWEFPVKKIKNSCVF